MWKSIRGIGLGLLLIALCGAVLLGSDWKRRVKRAPRLTAVSVFQFSPRDLLTESVQGCLDRLAERGRRHPQLRGNVHARGDDQLGPFQIGGYALL